MVVAAGVEEGVVVENDDTADQLKGVADIIIMTLCGLVTH